MRIACLHTAGSNVDVFQIAALGLGVELTHEVRPDLLARAEADGELTHPIRVQTAAILRRLAVGADAVLLTCSTLGPAVDDVAAAVPVLRVDQALARAAVARAGRGGRVLVLCAAPTTLVPTRALFEAEAMAAGVEIETRIVDGAWIAFRDGDIDRYHALVAQAADAAHVGGVRVIALAQASMAGAAAHCDVAAPLTSPAAGLQAAARS